MKKKNVFLLCFLAILFLFGGIVNTNQAKAAKTEGSGKVMFSNIFTPVSNIGSGRNVALDSNNYPHICVYAAGNLYHFYYNPENTDSYFSNEAVDTNGGSYCSIAVNKSNNDVHISYQKNTRLYYAKKVSGGSWTKTEIGSDMYANGVYSSIALDSYGNPKISHKDTTSNDLEYAYFDGSAWNNTTVYSVGNVGTHSSIAIDSNNNVHIVYDDTTNGNLLYATGSNGSFTQTNRTIDTLSAGGSVAVGTDNIVRIAYQKTGGFDLGYAYGSNATWTTSSAVESVVPSDISLALDSSNNPHVSSRNGLMTWSLYYNYFNGSSWTSSSVDNTSNTGYYTSIAFGNNNAYLVYQAAASGALNFVLVDSVVPSGTASLTGLTGNVYGWNLSASDYVQMGGAKYYCVDEANTCTPTTSLSAATALGSHTVSNDSVKTLYLRLKDWSGNLTSLAMTEGAAERQIPVVDVKVINDDLTYIWKKLPENPENYWIKTFRYKKYTKKFPNYKSNIIKRYWKINTNLYNYHKKSRAKLITAEKNYSNCFNSSTCDSATLKKYKKVLVKYQNKMFKVRVKFYYTAKLSNMLRLKNSTLSMLSKKQAEKKLWLKVYNTSTKTWANMSKLKLINKTIQSTKNKTFATDLRYFRQKSTLFTIGVK